MRLIMKIRNTYLIALLLALFSNYTFGQKLTLEYCISKAEEISPLSRQKLHYETLEEFTQTNVSNANLPSFYINGQASYQSDVFSFPNNPIFESPIIPNEQFKVTLDVNQKIYDGGLTKNKKIAESAKILTDVQSVEVDLYEIKTTISSLYFSALIYQENIKILKNVLEVLRDQQKVIDSQVINGLILKSALTEFKKQILSTEQQILSLSMDQQAMLNMLGKWVDEDIDTSDKLEVPNVQIDPDNYEINRPEVRLMETQNIYFESLKNMSSVKRRPSIWAIAQAGFGQPNAYNFLETDVADFYYVGLRLSWHMFDYGNAKRERSIYEANQAIVNAKKEFLLDNIDLKLTKEYAEVNKIKELIDKDEELVSLQGEIVESSFSQVQHGVITTTEYISQLNSKTQLELIMQLHKIQLVQAVYNCLNISGNL